jgi:hypothetical protein
MMRKASPLFLERRSYRLRRLVDAARLLPFLGALLFAVPMLWPQGEDGAILSSNAIFYIFGVWVLLVVVTLVLSLFLEDTTNVEREAQPPVSPVPTLDRQEPPSHGGEA